MEYYLWKAKRKNKVWYTVFANTYDPTLKRDYQYSSQNIGLLGEMTVEFHKNQNLGTKIQIICDEVEKEKHIDIIELNDFYEGMKKKMDELI